MSEKTVMVSGCYDLLHAGHIAFFKTAAQYGKLYVYVGQDENIRFLKGKAPYFSQGNANIWSGQFATWKKPALLRAGECLILRKI
jgi:cytidyltransferase-like protein